MRPRFQSAWQHSRFGELSVIPKALALGCGGETLKGEKRQFTEWKGRPTAVVASIVVYEMAKCKWLQSSWEAFGTNYE